MQPTSSLVQSIPFLSPNQLQMLPNGTCIHPYFEMQLNQIKILSYYYTNCVDGQLVTDLLPLVMDFCARKSQQNLNFIMCFYRPISSVYISAHKMKSRFLVANIIPNCFLHFCFLNNLFHCKTTYIKKLNFFFIFLELGFSEALKNMRQLREFQLLSGFIFIHSQFISNNLLSFNLTFMIWL